MAKTNDNLTLRSKVVANDRKLCVTVMMSYIAGKANVQVLIRDGDCQGHLLSRKSSVIYESTPGKAWKKSLSLSNKVVKQISQRKKKK